MGGQVSLLRLDSLGEINQSCPTKIIEHCGPDTGPHVVQGTGLFIRTFGKTYCTVVVVGEIIQRLDNMVEGYLSGRTREGETTCRPLEGIKNTRFRQCLHDLGKKVRGQIFPFRHLFYWYSRTFRFLGEEGECPNRIFARA